MSKYKDMVQVLCQNIENFSRNSYFQVGGLHVRIHILCALIWSPIFKKFIDANPLIYKTNHL